MIYFETLPGLTARVDKVVFDPSLNAPKDRPYPFVYFVTIANESDHTVTIFGRKWVVRDTSGRIEVYEGDGVVGQFPRIEPGKHFHYNSYHVIRHESWATGAFFGSTESGRTVCAQVPEFSMEPPMFA